LGSLWSERPLIFRFALASMGADTPAGRAFADLWRYPDFRHNFRVMTVAWGGSWLAVAAAQAVIIEMASAGVAKTSSSVMPLAVAGAVAAWTVVYSKRGRRRGERAAAAAASSRGQDPPSMRE
ncbi:MAG: hypothetical protein ACRDNS_12120, partial [Trebonia sp.]